MDDRWCQPLFLSVLTSSRDYDVMEDDRCLNNSVNKLNVYSMVFGPTHKIGNNASKLGIFLWSKIIKTIWICRKLLEESKPCSELENFRYKELKWSTLLLQKTREKEGRKCFI